MVRDQVIKVKSVPYIVFIDVEVVELLHLDVAFFGRVSVASSP